MSNYPAPLPSDLLAQLRRVTRQIRRVVDKRDCSGARYVNYRPWSWEIGLRRRVIPLHVFDDAMTTMRRRLAYVNDLLEMMEEKYYEPGGVFVTRDACWNKTTRV